MKTLHNRCAGLDVHKVEVVACLRLVRRRKVEREVRRLLKKIGEDVRKYISIKFLTSSLTGILSYVFLKVVGVDFSEFWAILIFLLNLTCIDLFTG